MLVNLMDEIQAIDTRDLTERHSCKCADRILVSKIDLRLSKTEGEHRFKNKSGL